MELNQSSTNNQDIKKEDEFKLFARKKNVEHTFSYLMKYLS